MSAASNSQHLLVPPRIQVPRRCIHRPCDSVSLEYNLQKVHGCLGMINGDPMSFDVRRMLLLAEVARRGSITGAAQALTYTPSAVSQPVSRLETDAGQSRL